MIYRLEFSGPVLAQIHSYPSDVKDDLIAVLARVSENPYDPLVTVPTSDPYRRWADFDQARGTAGLLIFDDLGVVYVREMSWNGI